MKALIAPHAGLEFSGAVQAGAYANVDPTRTRTVFILGPSHHTGSQSCSLTRAEECETPLGDLMVDTEIVVKLRATKKFTEFSRSNDELEHSIEMHLPMLKHVLG